MPKKKVVKTEDEVRTAPEIKAEIEVISDRFTVCTTCGKRLPKEDFKQFKGDRNQFPFCSTECYNK